MLLHWHETSPAMLHAPRHGSCKVVGLGVDPSRAHSRTHTPLLPRFSPSLQAGLTAPARCSAHHPQITFNTSGLQLRSALAAAWGCDPPVTNKTPQFAGCLDYLWVSPQHWEVAQALELPYCWEKGREVEPREVRQTHILRIYFLKSAQGSGAALPLRKGRDVRQQR